MADELRGQVTLLGMSAGPGGTLVLDEYNPEPEAGPAPAPIAFERTCLVSRDGAITITETGKPPKRPANGEAFERLRIPAAALQYATEATIKRKTRSRSWDVTPNDGSN